MKGTKFFAIALFSTAFLSFTPINKKYIVIDAGHGGNDMGAVRNGISEKNIVLNIVKEIQKYNHTQDKYEIILTRDNDSYIKLADRADLVNKLDPEMVVSLHINSSSQSESTQQGQEIYIQNSEGSKKLAEKIAQKFNPSPVISEKNLHLLKESKSPTVIVELGYINNTQDREYMTSKKGQKEIAQKFVEIFNEY